MLQAVKILASKNFKFIVEITDGVDTNTAIQSYFGDAVPKQIRIVPQIEDVQKRFHECDWFISASRHEQFPYAITEAMLSGTPILSSKIEGVSWALGQPSIETFESENAWELAQQMGKIIRGVITKTEEDLIRARDYILKNYTADVWARKLIEFYDQITNKKE